MKKSEKSVGERIAALRKERGLSQKELAGSFVTAAYVSRVENGARNASLDTIQFFAQRLGTTVEYLQTGVKAVATLLLEEYAPFLAEYDLDPKRLTTDDILRLGRFTHEAIARSADDHPLRIAVAVLKMDNELSQNPSNPIDELFAKVSKS